MLSIITPTHKPTHLMRLYESIKAQTCKDFEWVVVPNNGADVSFLPKEDWIRIVPSTSDSKFIGAIKNFAFHQGNGEYLAEMDHDDEMMPECVEEILKAAESGYDFIYSDNFDINADLTSNTFGSAFGWTHYEANYNNKSMLVNRTPLPTPQTVSRIWFAPNHIRVWKRDFYRKIGGHETTLKALDDQDLMCRTYIEGSMYKIEKVLYVYHYHENNSFSSQELNKWIQDYTFVLHEKYIHQMVEKWCDVQGLLKVNLSKNFQRPGFITIDVDQPLNMQENTVGMVIAEDTLQSFKDPINTMKKIWYILAPGGMLLSTTPSTDGRGAFQDPTHLSYWNLNSFWYYTRAETAKYIGNPVRFQATHIKNYFPTDWHKEHNIPYVLAHLTALKGGNEKAYAPGIIEI